MPPDYDFDISLSFAGEHRPYVTEVASGLRQRGFNVFYDQFSRAEILGQDLINFLQDVYSRRSAVVAAFISEQWVSRPWPTHERQTVLARALLDAQAADLPFLLPFRFDDTPVPGLQPSVAYEDLRELYPGERRWVQNRQYKNPTYVTSLLTRMLVRRGLGPADLNLQEVDTEPVIKVRLIWLDSGAARQAVGPIPLEHFERGEIEFASDEVEAYGPPAGHYKRLREELWVAIDPSDPLPVLLVSTHEAREKSWAAPLKEPSQEVTVVDRVRRQLQQAVEMEVAGGAIPLGPTFTSTHDTPYGLGVRGVCVLAHRAPGVDPPIK